jgi:hypothetical protein
MYNRTCLENPKHLKNTLLLPRHAVVAGGVVAAAAAGVVVDVGACVVALVL